MDRYLKDGSRIKNPDRSGEYEIRGIIGTGASCVVYLADFFESSGARTEHLLKEYNPKRIRIERDDHGILRIIDEKDHAAFESGLQRFVAGYQMQLNVRRCSEMKNSTSNIQSIFEANGTRYIDMTVMEGKTYDQVQEDSLYDLLRQIKTITEVVANYHENGLLHLDIKPENILALPETVEMVQIFDYDSVTPKKDVIHSAFLSYTQSWAAQEQILPNRRNRICEATDLFAIGEILFHKLMGRHSESHERRSFSSYRFDYSADIFEGVNPRVFGMLEDILRHTICNKCADRYQTASELLETLTDAIELADPRKPFLQHHLPSKSSYFVGRDAQLLEIADRLKRTDKLFISGMGGMGKSELVKQYAHTYQDAYDAVIFAVCNTDLESMILDDSMLPIGNVQQWPDEKAQEYYTRKLKELQKLCNKRILLIVDNFNDLQDEALNALLRLNCKMLFTTRCDVTEYNYEQMELGTMAEEYVWDLFCNWYARQPVNEERMYARQIIDLYQGHTMAVELIAKQMKASHIGPKQMLDKLGSGGFRTGGRERVIHVKDGMHPKLNIRDHIRRLFDVSELNDEQIYILANLSLMPPSGVSAEMFHDWCQLDGYEDINELAESGWLRQDPEANMISLHPVIADVMLEELEKDFTQCELMLKSVISEVKEEAIPNMETVKASFSRLITAKINVLGNQHVEVSELHIILGDLYVFLREYDDAHMHFEKALRIINSADGGNEGHIALVHKHMGLLNYAIGNDRLAIEHCRKHLDFVVCTYGEDSVEASNAFSDFAAVHVNTNPNEAERWLRSSLQVSLRVYGEFNEQTAIAYSNLSEIYGRLNEWEKAEMHGIKALDIRTKLYGKGSPKVAESHSSLGRQYSAFGLLKKAEENYLTALRILQDFYGLKHSKIADILNELGMLYQEMESVPKAEKYYSMALEMFTDIYGPTHILTSNCYSNLGSLYHEQNNFPRAEACFLKALNIRLNALDTYNVSIAMSYSSLGHLYHDWKRYERAERYYLDSLQIRLALWGEVNQFTAVTYDDLCSLYYDMGKFKKAEKHILKAIEINEQLYGKDHMIVELQNEKAEELRNVIACNSV